MSKLLRKASDSAKWNGSIVGCSLNKKQMTFSELANKAHIQYKSGKTNLWLFVMTLNFQKVEVTRLVNRGTQHLRYNRKISPERVKWEVFLQGTIRCRFQKLILEDY